MELFKAHEQWKNRPADERFSSLGDLRQATHDYAKVAVEKEVSFGDLRTEAIGTDLVLVGKQNNPARLTNWAFGQLASRVGAPASYLRGLPSGLASENLNYGLYVAKSDDKTAQLLFHQNGELLVRAITSDKYTRIWNWEVADRLMDLEGLGWKPARPDIGGNPALYASDHDMFAFLKNKNLSIQEAGSEPLQRGVIIENSEVGASALKLTRFLYRYMCGNHIIWGASKVVDLSVRHVGEARERWTKFAMEIRNYSDQGGREDELAIRDAKETVIAATKEEVLDMLFGKRAIGLSRKVIEAGYDAVVPEEDGEANTVWGLAQGITRYSQTIPFADKRTEIDRGAGRILEVNF